MRIQELVLFLHDLLATIMVVPHALVQPRIPVFKECTSERMNEHMVENVAVMKTMVWERTMMGRRWAPIWRGHVAAPSLVIEHTSLAAPFSCAAPALQSLAASSVAAVTTGENLEITVLERICRAGESQTAQKDFDRNCLWKRIFCRSDCVFFCPVEVCELAESTAPPWAVCHRGKGLPRVCGCTRLFGREENHMLPISCFSVTISDVTGAVREKPSLAKNTRWILHCA